jgi:hypothetical protein
MVKQSSVLNNHILPSNFNGTVLPSSTSKLSAYSLFTLHDQKQHDVNNFPFDWKWVGLIIFIITPQQLYLLQLTLWKAGGITEQQ